jgi:hypothetical protein
MVHSSWFIVVYNELWAMNYEQSLRRTKPWVLATQGLFSVYAPIV